MGSDVDIDTYVRALDIVLEESKDNFDDTSQLIDLYLLLSQVETETEDLRKDVSDILLDRVDEEASSQYGSLSVVESTTWSVEDEKHALEVLDKHGIPRMGVMSIDSKKVEEVCEENDINKGELMEKSERRYLRRTDLADAVISELVDSAN